MKSFSTAIISDSISTAIIGDSLKSTLPPTIATVGWALGSAAGLAIGLGNQKYSLCMLLVFVEMIIHYTLVLARDPKSNDLSCTLKLK